jgi:hypothetical protein
MIEAIEDVQPLDTFRDDPLRLLEQLRSTHRPMTLTVDGKAAVILQDPLEYERILDLLDQAE